MRLLSILFLLFSATGAIAQAGQPVQNLTNTERPIPVPVYTSLIVTACPKRWGDTTLRPVVPDHPDYDHWQKPDYTGCQDVPVPSWAMTWDFTPAACKSIPGYIASMQFLQQQQQFKDWIVGGWTCHFSITPPQLGERWIDKPTFRV
jgi:hypothetical protein